MANGDRYRITTFGHLYSETCENVYDFLQTAGSGGASDLLAAWEANVHPAVADCQEDDFFYDRILCQNWDTPTDNAEDLTPTPSTGTHTGSAALPQFIALAWRSTRPDLSKRYSYKRVAGVPLSVVAGPYVDTGFLATEMAAAATAMQTTLATGGSYFQPVQLHLAYPGGGGAPVVTVNYAITEWIARDQVTTQDSRKRGRGI